jgi:hypothetical protein
MTRMKEVWRFGWDEQAFWVPKLVEIDGKVKKRSIRIHIVRYWLETDADVVGPKRYRIIPTCRDGRWRYSISVEIPPPKKKWPIRRRRGATGEAGRSECGKTAGADSRSGCGDVVRRLKRLS